jgi:Tol biopolymer transport system component
MRRRVVLLSVLLAVVAAAGAEAGPLARSVTVPSAPTFVAARGGAGTATICAALGGGTTRAVNPRNAYVDHAWDPNGDRVAVVVTARSTWRLDVMRPDGTGRRTLSTSRHSGSSAAFGEPAWSPRGDLIAFIRDRSLFVVRPNGRDLRRLLAVTAPGLVWYDEPSWSPDGRRIFVLHVSFGPLEVRPTSVLRDGSGPRLEPYRGDFSLGTYSADRTQVAWAGPGHTVQIVSPDGGVSQNVEPTVPWRPRSPVWSPDGSRIAYVRRAPDGTTELFGADVASGLETRLTYNRLVERDVAWQPRALRRFGPCGLR